MKALRTGAEAFMSRLAVFAPSWFSRLSGHDARPRTQCALWVSPPEPSGQRIRYNGDSVQLILDYYNIFTYARGLLYDYVATADYVSFLISDSQ